MVKTPKTVLLLTWRFSYDKQKQPHDYRIVIDPTGDDDAWYPASFVIERRVEDALGKLAWRPSNNFDDIPSDTLILCVLGRLPDMVLTGASKRTERGQLPPGWRVCSDDDTLEIDCGTFEAQP